MPRAQSKKARHVANLVKPGDNVFDGSEMLPTDIIIPVMGPTGVGKSTFINNVIESGKAPVSDGFESSTRRIEYCIVDIPAQYQRSHARGRLVLVDTPGFDDTYLDDADILRHISVWLASSYYDNISVGGVVYLYSICTHRMTCHDRANLSVFQKLCGTECMSSVVLGTTRRSLDQAEAGELREGELKENFWKDMLNNGSQICRLEDNAKSAWEIVAMILQANCERRRREESLTLQVQAELVTLTKSVPQTRAARELRKKLKKLLRRFRTGNTMTKKGAPPEQIRNILSQLEQLKIPFSVRLLEFFGIAQR